MARNLRAVRIVSVVEARIIKVPPGTIPVLKNLRRVFIKKDDSNMSKTAAPKENKATPPCPVLSSDSDSEASDSLSEFESDDGNDSVPNEFKCEFCNKILISKQGLEEHLNTHDEFKPHQCNVCRKRFHLESNLETHQKNHSKMNTCKICGKKFKGSYMFRRHINSHPSTKPFACPVCNKLFATTDDLAQHTISGDNPGRCNACNRKFCHFKDLEKHKKVHEKNFECKVCNLKLASKRNLKVHMLKHTGELPHPCMFCKKSFRCLSILKEHVRVHTGEKPYECDLCGMSFPNSKILKYHDQMKHTDRPSLFECGICGKRFKTKTCINRHVKTHRPKQHRCDVCDKMFSQSCAVTRHKRRVHKIYLDPVIPECQLLEPPDFSSLIDNM